MPGTRETFAMKMYYRISLPVVILLFAGLGTFSLIVFKSKPEKEPRKILPTVVEVVIAEKRPVTFIVKSQGTVVPRTETDLIPEVSGKITAISPSLYAGGFFEVGELLVEIDSSDYAVALVRAESVLAKAKLNLSEEVAKSEQALKDWENLGNGEATELVLRKPHLIDAEANVKSAQADLEKARRDLERTRIRAPYAGMVKEKKADLGQFVSPGVMLAKIYAINYVEVRLPIPSHDISYVDLPYAYQGKNRKKASLSVLLEADFGGHRYTWDGLIVRTEGVVDPRSRVIYAVAQVQDPYRQEAGSARPPLQIGMFVKAEIRGKKVEDAVILPRHALRQNNRVLVVDASDTLVSREVKVIRADTENVIIGAGLEDGDKVCLTALEFVVGGMKVTTQMAVEKAGGEDPAFEENVVSTEEPNGDEEI